MSKTSAWAALYFIFLMTFGNYVLFNLLVAILVEGFSAEVRKSIGQLYVHFTRTKNVVLPVSVDG
jgi:hypothetical protein